VNSVRDIINSLLQFLIELGDIIVGAIVEVELWLRGQLSELGLPQPLQTAILVVLAIVLIVSALRLFGGLIRVAVVLVLILIAIHILLPILQH
jgi:hypothetical protein